MDLETVGGPEGVQTLSPMPSSVEGSRFRV